MASSSGPASSRGGHPVHIIRIENGERDVFKFVLDKEALMSVLKKVGNAEVAIVSVTGAFRTGKSFYELHDRFLMNEGT